MEKPEGHADFAGLIRKLWGGQELRAIAESIEELERHPGYAYLQALLDARERHLVDRLVKGPPGEVRATDQVLGICNGLRSGVHAADSIRYEAEQSRERDQAAADAVAEGASQ